MHRMRMNACFLLSALQVSLGRLAYEGPTTRMRLWCMEKLCGESKLRAMRLGFIEKGRLLPKPFL